jgi:cation:H+ antiporter
MPTPDSVTLQVLVFLGGVALLVGGGDLLVRGASRIAERFGVSRLVIGLTIVAFGTSTPELAVNVASALRGTDSIGYGNIVGSNICNIALILGIAALLRPLDIHSDLFRRDLPFMLLASVLVIAGSYAPPHTEGGAVGLSRLDGAIFLGFFFLCLFYTLRGSRSASVVGPELALEAEHLADARSANVPLLPAILFTIGGLVLLMLGGEVTRASAVALARSAGLSETLIGLTIVAVSTSLPELATSVIASYKKESDIAVGNVVGSNIYNVLFILGVTALIDPITLPADAGPSLVAMLATAFVLVPVCLTGKRISRPEGALLLTLYIAYLAWEGWRAAGSPAAPAAPAAG